MGVWHIKHFKLMLMQNHSFFLIWLLAIMNCPPLIFLRGKLYRREGGTILHPSGGGIEPRRAGTLCNIWPHYLAMATDINLRCFFFSSLRDELVSQEIPTLPL